MINYKAIIFDLEGVLFNINYQATFEAFKTLGINVKWDQSFTLLVEQADKGLISADELFHQFKTQYNCPDLTQEQFQMAWNRMMIFIPDDRLEYLWRLKQQGYQLILLSNINILHAADVAATYGDIFSKLFTQVFLSYQTHHLKPERASFDDVSVFLQTQYGIQPEETLFIDDSKTNVNAALAAQIAAHTFPCNGYDSSKKQVFLGHFVQDCLIPHSIFKPANSAKNHLRIIDGSGLEWPNSKAV